MIILFLLNNNNENIVAIIKIKVYKRISLIVQKSSSIISTLILSLPLERDIN